MLRHAEEVDDINDLSLNQRPADENTLPPTLNAAPISSTTGKFVGVGHSTITKLSPP